MARKTWMKCFAKFSKTHASYFLWVRPHIFLGPLASSVSLTKAPGSKRGKGREKEVNELWRKTTEKRMKKETFTTREKRKSDRRRFRTKAKTIKGEERRLYRGFCTFGVRVRHRSRWDGLLRSFFFFFLFVCLDFKEGKKLCSISIGNRQLIYFGKRGSFAYVFRGVRGWKLTQIVK